MEKSFPSINFSCKRPTLVAVLCTSRSSFNVFFSPSDTRRKWKCVSAVGEHISLGICVSRVGEHISLGICVSHLEQHSSLGICVSQVGEHESLGICVSQVGEQYCLPGSPESMVVLPLNTCSSSFLDAKTFKKVSLKKRITTDPWLGEEMRDWPCLKDFTVNQCAVLWCGRDLGVETAHSHLPCFALWRKTTPNKQRAAKPYKMAMNWAPVTQKKQQQAQVDVSTIYFYIHAHISTF